MNQKVNRRCTQFSLRTLLLFVTVTSLWLGISAHKLRRDVAQLRIGISLPDEDERYGDAAYQAIVRHGDRALPLLVDLIGDPSDTGRLVPDFGGTYAVGDFAVIVIWHIVPELPLVSMLDEPYRSDPEHIGFGTYYSFVRATPKNRATLQRRIKEWLGEHHESWVVRATLRR